MNILFTNKNKNLIYSTAIWTMYISSSRTVAVDMRGYGDSEKPDGYKYYRMRYLIEDVKNIIEGLGIFYKIHVLFMFNSFQLIEFIRLLHKLFKT